LLNFSIEPIKTLSYLQFFNQFVPFTHTEEEVVQEQNEDQPMVVNP